jgi:hypothetical protein
MIKLTKNDPAAGGRHHIIPTEWIENVEQNKIRLSKTASEARSHWVGNENDQSPISKSNSASG